ncbi:PAS domain S-box protein [candidate division WOR-3 bacterium]|nr:PAS domain S-box protein [candidate division WOR-3 bacterium]
MPFQKKIILIIYLQIYEISKAVAVENMDEKTEYREILIFTETLKIPSKLIKSIESSKISVSLSSKRSHLKDLSVKKKPALVIFSAYKNDGKNVSILKDFISNPSCRSIPIIFLLTKENNPDSIIPILRQMDDFIVSPFKKEELVNRIKKSLSVKAIKNKTIGSNQKKFENDYRRLIHFNPVAIAIHSEGIIKYANIKASEVIGSKTPDDLIGMRVFDFVHPNFKNIVAERTKLAQQENKHSGPLEEKFLTLDGREIDVEVTSFPILYKNKISSLVMVKDITSLKRAERELKESENKFKRLFEYLPDAVILSKAKGKNAGSVIDINKSAQNQTGFTREELLKKNALSDPCIRVVDNSSLSGFQKTISEGEPFLFTERKTKKDGTDYWLESLSTIIDRDNDSILISVCRDITKQKEAEENAMMLSHSIQKSPTLILIADKRGFIEYVNPKFTEVTGYDLEEVRGQKLDFLKTCDSDANEYLKLWETILSGETWIGELKNKKKNGEIYWGSITIAPIKNEQNEIIRFFCLKEDITAIRQLNQQLAQIHKLDSIGKLAGEMAHDFKNMVSIISNLAEIIDMKVSEGESFERELFYIKDSCKKASDLTNRLLTFSRKQDFNPIMLDLNEAVVNFQKMTKNLIGDDIDFKLELSTDIGPIKADPLHLEQLLFNLTMNAKDAVSQKQLKQGHRYITIETKNVNLDENYLKKHLGLNPGNYIRISVSDNGMGMSEEFTQRIFEPFFTTKEKGKGSGLGLSIVYGIVKQNHGAINIYSEINVGTTVKVYWPVPSPSGCQK